MVKYEKDTTLVANRKYKAGLAMSHPKISPQKLQEIREFAAGWGKIVARRVFGESGPGLDVDFQAMEEVAAAAAAGLTEGTFTTLLEQQTQALAPEHPDEALPRGLFFFSQWLTDISEQKKKVRRTILPEDGLAQQPTVRLGTKGMNALIGRSKQAFKAQFAGRAAEAAGVWQAE